MTARLDFSGARVFVTGGTRGIGKAIAVEFARCGARVAINFLRNRSTAEEALKELEAHGTGHLLVKGNVADEVKVATMFDAIEEQWGGLDILVSNAASGVLKPAMEMTMKHLHWTLDINAGALLPLAQGAVRLMNEGWGKIVAVSSLGATRALPNYFAVGASKGALESMIRHLMVELAPQGINVNAVSAGLVDTDALTHFPNREEMLDGAVGRTPSGRLTTPLDVANAVLFLCSRYAAQVHGQTLIIDGGSSVLA
ncbi:MAG: enoyl-[acyl-carrier-protein] reductase FabL [Planctomycetes bacterium]|nr:enoyl-[acyl-carrier-protein] reductase FabL [Planctomycetota bacterium]